MELGVVERKMLKRVQHDREKDDGVGDWFIEGGVKSLQEDNGRG